MSSKCLFLKSEPVLNIHIELQISVSTRCIVLFTFVYTLRAEAVSSWHPICQS
jgi:hypothetical protein